MSALTSPLLDIPLLNSKKDLVGHYHDQDWIENITVLTGDFELSQMSLQRDYGPMVRRASRESDVALHRHRSKSLREHEARAGVLK